MLKRIRLLPLVFGPAARQARRRLPRRGSLPRRCTLDPVQHLDDENSAYASAGGLADA